MKQKIIIREATAQDKPFIVEMAVNLALYNRKHHREESRYDDFDKVLDAIRYKAEETIINVSPDVLILIAVLNDKPSGYAIGRIFREGATADNGTGDMGLFDELFIDESARGQKLGQQLTEGIMKWMKLKGMHRVKLHAYSWNTTAKKLYERNGFVEYASSFEKFI